jgi:para-nitrobenzyl esterase
MLELSLGGELAENAEDCLSLNLWTPGIDIGRRPVMVWIHGGSFLSGSGSLGLYRGGLLAREGDVVVVTINYRLGLLGFLAHPDLEEAGQTWLDGSGWSGFGNWGLADQVAALHWVRAHVASFGGNPDNVTVFGESAGGMSISALLAVPAARGLFRRAIVESGPPYTLSAEAAIERTEELAAHLGVVVKRGALERVPADALVAAAADVGSRLSGRGQSGLLMMPVVDGGLLPSAPEAAVEAGSASDVALLIGTTRDETAFFSLGNPRFASLDEPGLRDWVRVLFPERSEADQLIAGVRQARQERDESVVPRDLWTAISTEYLFRWPSLRLASAHASASSDGAGTYCYLFTWDSPAFGGVLGSCHALEIPFVFGTVHLPGVQVFSGGGDGAFALSAAMRQAWVAFARTGSPVAAPSDGFAGSSASAGLGSLGSVDLPGSVGSVGSVGAGGSNDPAGDWSAWDPARRPTMVFGPWPGDEWTHRQVDAPRDEELERVALACDPDRIGGPAGVRGGA